MAHNRDSISAEAPRTDSLSTLRRHVAGPVLARGDPGMAEEVFCFNTRRKQDPEVAVGATCEADVATAVRYAVGHGLPVYAQATGHGAGKPPVGGLLITTGRMAALRIDPAARLARIGAGVQWQRVVDAAAEFGLAPIVGSSTIVGAVGYTLGGGLGPLARSHGFSSDWVRGFRVVTAQGYIVLADAVANPDLFWALRGGKGGLGFVTEMTVELVPLPELYAGGLYFQGAQEITAALHGWAAWLPDAPPEVSTSVALLRDPDQLHLRFAYPGGAVEGRRLIAPLRALAPAVRDTAGPVDPRAIGTIHEDPEHPLPLKSFCAELSEVSPEFAAAFLAQLGPGSDTPFSEAELRHLGGAAARDTAETTAAGGREGAVMLRLVHTDPGDFAAAKERAQSVIAAAKPWSTPVTSVNFGGDMALPAAFESAWPTEIAARLARIRGRYDPNRVFPFGPP